jgi:murein DD-endopeptidase MepM/ murein hydrolase activator NlpD
MNKRIKNRKALIDNYGRDLELVKTQLRSNEVENSYLKSRLDTVKTKYYNLLNESYKYNLSYNKWAFILNAKSINDSFLRWQYLKQYKAYCVESYNYLLETQEAVNESTKELNELINSREDLLLKEQDQLALIEEDKDDLNDKLKVLKNDEAQLNQDLTLIKTQRENLNQAIEKSIVASLKGETIVNETFTYGVDFSSQKTRLAWPVKNGKVVSGFGKQRHPNFKEITITNNGIDISCTSGSMAYAVHPGKIVSINKVVGYENIVIVQHGSFYTVYSKLERVLVNKGDQINKGDQLGLIYLNEQGETIFHFEIWEGREKQNPSSWLNSSI